MEPPVSLSLGQTTGVLAAWAWAARWKLASLLEARCNSDRVLELIHKGEEGDHVLSNSAPEARPPPSSVGSWSPVTTSKPGSRKEGDGGDVASDSETWEKDIHRQAAILEPLMTQSAADLPPWVKGGADPSYAAGSAHHKPAGVFAPPAMAAKSSGRETAFSRPAAPPPAGCPGEIKQVKREEDSSPVTSTSGNTAADVSQATTVSVGRGEESGRMAGPTP